MYFSGHFQDISVTPKCPQPLSPGGTADDASFGVALSSVYALADDELNGSSYQTTIFLMLAATNRRRTVSSYKP
jgi:hypothetical protein